MEKYCIYKLKEGKRLNEVHELFTRYVYLEDFGINPLEGNDCFLAVYRYIDIETLIPSNPMLGLDILPIGDFEEYFELYLDTDQIKDKIIDMD